MSNLFSLLSYSSSDVSSIAQQYSTVTLIFAILTIVATWMIFKKCGYAGWKSLIPFYNTYIFFKIAWGNGWMFLTMLIPVANIVFIIITYNKLSKSFGKGVGFTCGLIFLNTIFIYILGFGNAQYLGPQ